VLNHFLAQQYGEPKNSVYFDKLLDLARYENIHVKMLGAGLSTLEIESALNKKLARALTAFGDQRVMFGGGSAQSNGNAGNDSVSDGVGSAKSGGVSEANRQSVSFDQLWNAYAISCEDCSARVRDKLFRTNAIRIYRI